MALANTVLEAHVRDFLSQHYPNLTVTHVVELQQFLQFHLVDEGDFEGLSEFCGQVERRFNGSVELKRQSTKSFQLELLLPTSRAPRRSLCFDILPWILVLIMILGICLFATSALYWVSVPPVSS